MINLRLTLTVFLAATVTLSLAAGVSAQNNNPTKKTRALALSRIGACAKPQRAYMCDEDDADFLIKLYWRGDRSLLRPLMDAGPNSDAALAEILGTFYEEVLEKQTRTFLGELAARPRDEQNELAHRAGQTDGGGMSPKMLRNVRRNLRRVASRRGDRLAPVARRCLAAIEDEARKHPLSQGA